jgi:very-short-patch-repair endonuclease
LVETDSWLHRRSRRSFEDDRRRDAIHAVAGYRTLRFTWRQIKTSRPPSQGRSKRRSTAARASVA